MVSKKEDGSSYYFCRNVLKFYSQHIAHLIFIPCLMKSLPQCLPLIPLQPGYQAGEDADIARVLGRGHDLHLPPSSRPRTLANDCVSVPA